MSLPDRHTLIIAADLLFGEAVWRPYGERHKDCAHSLQVGRLPVRFTVRETGRAGGEVEAEVVVCIPCACLVALVFAPPPEAPRRPPAPARRRTRG